MRPYLKCVRSPRNRFADRWQGWPEIDADVVAIQEILNVQGGKPEFDQVRCIVENGGYSWCFGKTRLLRGGPYGNVTLSRFPISKCRTYDLTREGRERRGCLQADIK